MDEIDLPKIFLFLIQVLAHNQTRTGSLYIAELEGKEVNQDLFIVDDKLVSGVGFSKFEFNGGTLKLVNSQKYLNVWEENYGAQNAKEDRCLVLSDFPQTGFFLTLEPGTTFQNRLLYLGEETFQLCGDNRVAHLSQCKDPRKIVINFEDI